MNRCCYYSTFRSNVKDYYQILGVPRNADKKQIKSAFYALSLKYHPDRSAKDEDSKQASKQKYLQITEAYAILHDDLKKRQYDRSLQEYYSNSDDNSNVNSNQTNRRSTYYTRRSSARNMFYQHYNQNLYNKDPSSSSQPQQHAYSNQNYGLNWEERTREASWEESNRIIKKRMEQHRLHVERELNKKLLRHSFTIISAILFISLYYCTKL